MIASSPVVVSVVHAGRDYPASIEPALAVPRSTAERLEDRYADALVQSVRVHPVFVMPVPRLLIDLNRAEDDLDERFAEGAPVSLRARAGLGLIPMRLGNQSLWQSAPTRAMVDDRIARWHRPFHAVIAEALRAAHARFGCAVLIDVHSMPPLQDSNATAVVGTRHGRTAQPGVVNCAEAVLRAAGFVVARDQPYAGGHMITRHADPAHTIDAVQIEIDRRTYLDARFDRPSAASVDIARTIGGLADRVAEWVTGAHLPLAAE